MEISKGGSGLGGGAGLFEGGGEVRFGTYKEKQERTLLWPDSVFL